jgi:hypothetical protein
MYRIQSNEYLKEMRAEIKEMWRHLPVENIRDGTERFAIYFSLEKQVMNEVVKYLKKTKNRHFTQHDGWICEHEIELYRLHSDIKNTTGFSINFSHITYF